MTCARTNSLGHVIKENARNPPKDSLQDMDIHTPLSVQGLVQEVNIWGHICVLGVCPGPGTSTSK